MPSDSRAQVLSPGFHHQMSSALTQFALLHLEGAVLNRSRVLSTWARHVTNVLSSLKVTCPCEGHVARGHRGFDTWIFRSRSRRSLPWPPGSGCDVYSSSPALFLLYYTFITHVFVRLWRLYRKERWFITIKTWGDLYYVLMFITAEAYFYRWNMREVDKPSGASHLYNRLVVKTERVLP